MRRLLLPCAALLLSAGLARAEGPIVPPQGEDPVEAIRRAAIRVSKALKENEEALTKIARGETAEAGPVDLDLPKAPRPDGSAPPSGGT